MLRKIIKIDQDKCNGCGICVNACHEGAIALKNGKAVLIRDDYCDGLGNCLPACPANAISFEEREASAYNYEAVIKHLQAQGKSTEHVSKVSAETIGNASSTCQSAQVLPLKPQGGCCGSRALTIDRLQKPANSQDNLKTHAAQSAGVQTGQKAKPAEVRTFDDISALGNWPVQIKLVPVRAEYFNNADLLIAADCTAYSRAAFHAEFMAGKRTIIGCPKLDEVDYSDKLAEIFRLNNIKSVTLARMSVPCCGGLERFVQSALAKSGKNLPYRRVIITPDGQILPE